MIVQESFKISEIKILIDQLSIVFDIVRLVDPITNLVLTYDEYGNKHLEDRKCYEVWGKTESCDNCLSLSAEYNSQLRRTKFEFMENEVFYVVSYPLKIDDMYAKESLVLEIVSKITDEVFFEAFSRDDIIEKITESNHLFYEDSLTKVYNRRFLDDGVFCKHQYRMIGRCVVFIMMDISRFKFINDTYGHKYGDDILRKVGKILKSTIRENDIAIRYGGDEFLIILSGCEEKFCETKISQFKSEISRIVYGEKPFLHLDADFGYSYCDIFKNDSKLIERLIFDADMKMYENKKKNHCEK